MNVLAVSEQAATRFNIGTFAGKLYATDIKLADLDYDGDLDLTTYMQSGLADLMGQNLQIYLNDGAGLFTFTPGKTPSFTPPSGGINAFDVADYTGDGSIDLWVGNQGGRVLAFTNTYVDPAGVPADLPRSVSVVSTTGGGVRLGWSPPPGASQVRFYRVYRNSTPGLPIKDRVLIKTVGPTAHADDNFVAPLTKLTSAAQLGDATVSINATTGELQWTDTTAVPGIIYFYSVVHVGNETKASAPSPELVATIAGPSGTDTTAPELTIVGPTRQQWSAFPRIILHYADEQSGVKLASLQVSFNAALGNPTAGGRAANANIADLAIYKDARVFAAPLASPYALPINTLVTMTVSIADMAGNVSSKNVQFFVTTASAQLPVASFTATPQSGLAPIDIAFDARASTDPDGRVVQYEWYFGDGSMGIGATTSYRYLFGGTYTVTLVVRDTQGGVGVTTQTLTTNGSSPECANGEVRACYSGPDGTGGVGTCIGALQSCLVGAWEATCSSEVVPDAEICDDGLDNDCDGALDVDDEDCGGTGGGDSGCCQSSGPSALPWMVVVLLVACRRRRRRAVTVR